jgi:hypothetical protein
MSAGSGGRGRSVSGDIYRFRLGSIGKCHHRHDGGMSWIASIKGRDRLCLIQPRAPATAGCRPDPRRARDANPDLESVDGAPGGDWGRATHGDRGGGCRRDRARASRVRRDSRARWGSNCAAPEHQGRSDRRGQHEPGPGGSPIACAAIRARPQGLGTAGSWHSSIIAGKRHRGRVVPLFNRRVGCVALGRAGRILQVETVGPVCPTQCESPAARRGQVYDRRTRSTGDRLFHRITDGRCAVHLLGVDVESIGGRGVM